MPVLKQKQALRREMKIKRAEYMNSNKGISALCEKTFLKSDIYKNASVILSYYSFGSEADTHLLIKTALSDGKKVFLPETADDFSMKFISCTDSEIYLGGGGVCIIPGLAFDSEGGRLGFGKGYYDRFLATNTELLKVAFCPECSFVDRVPTDKNDIYMQIIIKDNEIMFTEGGSAYGR